MDRDRISPRQLAALGFVSLLSPLVRRFPHTLASAAGRTGWLAVPLAAVPLLVWLALWRALLRRSRDLPALLDGALGRLPGRLVTGLCALWMLAYAGFLLRSDAVRQISTVYPEAGPAVFVLSMAAACAVAAAGPLRGLARSAMVLRPLLVGVIALVLLLSAESVDPGMLLPVTEAEPLRLGWAALQLANGVGAGFLLCFLCDRAEAPPSRGQLLGWGAALLGVVAGAAVCCIGMFGPELTAHMNYPFFMLARDVTILGAIERVEPVVVAMSVLSDFSFVSALLWMAARLCLRLTGRPDGERTGLSAVLCAAAAALVALLLPGGVDDWALLSDRLVPAISAVFTAAIPLAVLAAAKGRRIDN